MIVEDEDVTLGLRRDLEIHGYNINAFTDTSPALSHFKKDLYHVLLALKMPKMEGSKPYQNIRKADYGVKVCFITALEVYYDALKELFSSRTYPIALSVATCNRGVCEEMR